MRLAPRVRIVHQLLTESMWFTANQVMFSLASVVATAFVARTASVHDAASVFAVYAIESVVVTACRGFVITAPLLRHAGAKLCAGDMLIAFWVLSLIAVIALVPYALVGLWLSHSWPTALVTAIWASCMFFADIIRQIVVAFWSRVLATFAVGAYLIGVVVPQVTASDLAVEGYLAVVSLLSILLGIFLWLAVARDGDRHRCGFWTAERAFAGSQAAEGAGAVSMISITYAVLARLAPREMVGMQIASQALIGPALVIAYGFAVPFTRRAGLKQQAGESELKILVAWAGVLVVCMAAVVAASASLTGLLVRVFGSAWYAAEALVPALAVQSVVFVGSQIAMTRYRSRLRPVVLRRFWLCLVGLGYSTIVLAVLVWGPHALEAAIWASSAVMLGTAVTFTVSVERRARVAATV